jgi:hypothetical protein
MVLDREEAMRHRDENPSGQAHQLPNEASLIVPAANVLEDGVKSF